MTRIYKFTPNQIQHELKMLHKSVHRLLFLKENNSEKLIDYFDVLLCRISGLNTLLDSPSEIIDLLVILEGAKNQASKADCNFKIYRKMILDAHTLIDKISDKDGD